MRDWITILLLAGASAPVTVVAQERSATAGRFDYYVLSLSWSPEHCSRRPDDQVQCAGPRPYGFVLHGLWPQYEKGFPSSCKTKKKLDSATANSMLDIMPSAKLVQHEWSKHGTCDGAEAKEYFGSARKAFQAFQVPPELSQPLKSLTFRKGELKEKILTANPRLKANQVAVLCNGRFFQEVRVCLDKSLDPRNCSEGVRDRCSAAEMIVRPMR